MRHTLSSRFQGGFLGAAIGEILALESLALESSEPRWGKLAIDQMRRLTHSSSMSPEPRSEPFAKPPTASAGLAIALLPLAFFYHEDANLLNRQIRQKLEQWQVSSEMGMGAIAIGHAISLILREQFQPLDLIRQILAEIPDSASLVDSLTQVQGWLVEASIASQFSTHRLSWANASPLSPSVSPALVSLETIPIALALYAFLSTPEDFRLSLLRVAQFSGQTLCANRLTCSLTAALSGTHNGRGGLPQGWRKVLRDDDLKRQSLFLLWDVRAEGELLECVDRFILAWSGIHNPMRHKRSRTPVAVAIPRIIRSI